MRPTTWRPIALLVVFIGALFVALATVAGCDCGDDGDKTPGQIKVANHTAYYLHALQPGHENLYLAPGTLSTISWYGQDPLTVVVAAGQDAAGSFVTHEVGCCSKDCGQVEATWDGDALTASYAPPACDGGAGSCPYVYSWDGRDWRREAEMLVGALNRGAQRDDGLVLEHGTAADGPRVRIITERRETSYLDRVRLEVREHAPEVELALDQQGRVVPVAGARPVGGVTDGRGRDTSFAARPDEIAAATARGAVDFGGFRLTRLFDVAPAEAADPVLLLRVQNTDFIQDAYHAYMRQFGPGLPKLLRFVAGDPRYPFALAALLQSAGFGLEVAVRDGDAFRVVATIAPVGPAGPKTVAVPLGRPGPGTTRPQVRLTMLPEAWIVHEARVGARAAGAGTWRYVAPDAVTWRRRAGGATPLPTTILDDADGAYVPIGVRESVDLRFPALRAAPGQRVTAVLRVNGYYEELDSSRRPCLHLGVLRRCLREENAFAKFALGRLAPRSPSQPAAAPPIRERR